LKRFARRASLPSRGVTACPTIPSITIILADIAASHEVETLTIRIPIRLQRRGGRKLIITPEGATAPSPKPRRDGTLVKALVRAHRWRRKIESGRAKSITDLAEQEGVTIAYVRRLLRSPAWRRTSWRRSSTAGSRQGLRLAEMLGSVEIAWDGQRVNWGFGCSDARGRLMS